MTSYDANALELSHDEREVLDLRWALGPWEISNDLARRLGLADLAELKWVVRLSVHARNYGELQPAQWIVLTETIRNLADPDYTEWQTVTGFFYEETVALLDSINAKVRAKD